MYTFRPFTVPAHVAQAIDAGAPTTATLHAHAGSLGDYEMVTGWLKELVHQSNWGGNTLMFNVMYDEYKRQHHDEHPRYHQWIMEKDGEPVAYVRFVHLMKDTATRRKDCTKIEETVIKPSLRADMDVFKALYDFVADQAVAHGQKRVMTEHSWGLSPDQYRTCTRRMASLSGKPTTETQAAARYRETPDGARLGRGRAALQRHHRL